MTPPTSPVPFTTSNIQWPGQGEGAGWRCRSAGRRRGLHGCMRTGWPGSVGSMRLGVLDVGSNTVHLLVVDAYQGARPVPAFSHKAELRLGDHLDAANRLTQDCAIQLRDFVDEALRI